HYVPLSYTLFSLEAIVAARPVDENAVMTFDPAIFHGGSLLLHLGCVLLVFALLRRLVANDLAAAAGALLFAVHPLQVESVAWISETRGLLAGLFSLLAAWHYLTYASGSAEANPFAASAGS